MSKFGEVLKNIFYAILGIVFVIWIGYSMYVKYNVDNECLKLTKNVYPLIDNNTIEKVCECAYSSTDPMNSRRAIVTLREVAYGIEDVDHGNFIKNTIDSDRHECVIRSLAKAGISVYELSEMNNN